MEIRPHSLFLFLLLPLFGVQLVVWKIFGRKEKRKKLVKKAPAKNEMAQKGDELYESKNESVPDGCMKCQICFDHVPYDQLCFCDHLMNNEQIFGKNSSKKCEIKNESHAFCIECLTNYTVAAHEMAPFAWGGLGLKCMAQNCDNPIPWQEIKELLPEDQLKSIQALKNRCDELCVAMAGLSLQRCAKCNYAVAMDDAIIPIPSLTRTLTSLLFGFFGFCINPAFVRPLSTNVGPKKFHCPECHYEMCRKCNAKWTNEHNDLSCEQFAKQQNKKGFLKEQKLSEEVIHECPKCKIRIFKDGGCNHMKCNACRIDYCYCCQKQIDYYCGPPHYCSCVRQKVRNGAAADHPLKCANCKRCLLYRRF